MRRTGRSADTALSPQARRLFATLTAGLLLFAGPLVALLASPAARFVDTVLTELAVALVASSLYFFWRTRRLLGGFTAIAAISTAWALLSLSFATLSTSCPGFSASKPCSTAQLAANALLGALLPLVPVILLYPAKLTFTALRGLWRSGQKLASAKAPSTPKVQKKKTPAPKQSSGSLRGRLKR